MRSSTHDVTTWTARPPDRRTHPRLPAALIALALAVSLITVVGPTRPASAGHIGHVAAANYAVGMAYYHETSASFDISENFEPRIRVDVSFGASSGPHFADLCNHYEGGTGTGYFSGADGTWTETTLSNATIQTGNYAYALIGEWRDDVTGETGVFLSGGRQGGMGAFCTANYWAEGIVMYIETTQADQLLAQIGSIIESVPTVEEMLEASDLEDLIALLPPSPGPSEQCELSGGARVLDATSGGVRTYAYTHQPATGELWLCARVEDSTTGQGYGGRLELTPTDPEVSGVPGTPNVDSQSQACTATTDPPNQVPTTHPIASGGVLTVDYLIDAYASDTEVWVCLEAGSVGHRVSVPLGGDGTGVSGTAIAWYPDYGTPGG